MSSALLLAALMITGPRVELPPEQVQARFEAECADGRWNEAQCPSLRIELELQFYDELQELLSRGPVDRTLLHTAARARFPMLAELGLRKLGKIASDDDRAAVLAALEHPAPAIRGTARQMLDVQDDRWRKTLGPWWRAGTRNGFAGLVPDAPPDAARLGLAELKDASTLRYRYFASGDPRERRAVFTTRLSPDQVMALVGKGRKVFDGTRIMPGQKQQAELSKQMEGVQQQIQAAMMKGDMKTVTELSQRIGQQMQSMMADPDAMLLQPVEEFAAAPAAVRYAQLAPASATATPLTVAASREEAFGGETVVVFRY